MALIDYAYYTGTWFGELPEDMFPQFEARAELAIDAVTGFYATKNNGIDTLPSWIQSLYKKAICSQIDYLHEQGLSVSVAGASESSFSVGKVSVTSGKNNEAKLGSTMIAPSAVGLLEQTGLLYRGVSVGIEPFAPYPWWS